MTLPKIPARLAEGLASATGPYRQAMRSWVEDLPLAIVQARDKWGLDLDEPFEPGGQASWVAPGRLPAGDDVVLKIVFPHPEGEHEANGLRIWDGKGAVRLLDVSGDPVEALLVERCRPGTPLGHSEPEERQDEIVAGLLRRLWAAPWKGEAPFRPLAEMCELWVADCERDLAEAPEVVDPVLAAEGVAVWRELAAAGRDVVLLATDLHAENILAAEREPWLVIDPKPYVGDPCYDPLQHMVNCPGRLQEGPAGFAGRMAGLLDLDAGRVCAWLFARLIIESVWGRPWAPAVARQLAADAGL